MHDMTSERAAFPQRRRRRVWMFVGLCTLAVAGAVSYTRIAVIQRASATPTGEAPSNVRVLETPPARPYVVVSRMASRDLWARLVLVSVAAPNDGMFVTPFSCARAYVAGDRGTCLRQDDDSKHFLEIFDAAFRVLHRVPLTGVPSRTRVSPNGQWVGVTVFEQGHSYAIDGFSTRTTLVDTRTGQVYADLEQFRVERDGRRFTAPDFNFWGVTFAEDSNRFYATLASGGVNYLVEGAVDRRAARVVRAGVECPSLSPDGTRIAFKYRLPDRTWQLRVWHLDTGTEQALTLETRSVDDQVEWLDTDHVLYHMPGPAGNQIWKLDTRGGVAPQVFMEGGYSPAVIR